MYMYWRRQWQPTPVLLPGRSHGRKSLVGFSPWGRKESTERLRFYFSLSCIREGNGNPLQCSCLESPRDSRAWWAAIYGVAQSRTQLKWLSSSSRGVPSPSRKWELGCVFLEHILTLHFASSCHFLNNTNTVDSNALAGQEEKCIA